MGPPINNNTWFPGLYDNANNARDIASNITDIYEQELAVTEPVTIVQAKAQCRVDFTDDDAFITGLLTSCRQTIEKFCNISLVIKTITLTLDLIAPVEIPYGPVQSITSFVDNQSNVIDPGTYMIAGVKFQKLVPLNFSFYAATMVYQAGYDGTKFVVEQNIILAILNEISFRYENRGEASDSRKSVNPGICEAARILAGPYQRAAWV